MAKVLIAGKDWTARTLLRAQLIEEGFDVEAYETVSDVVQRLWGSRDKPALLIVDLIGSDDPAEDVSLLSQWTKLLPVWILAGHGVAGIESLSEWGFERIMFRPLDLGKLVQEIKVRLTG